MKVPPQAIRALQRQKTEQETALLGIEPGDYVFGTTRKGGVVSAPALYHGLRRETERLRVRRISFHALRHTFATLALTTGANPKDIQAVLGHPDPTLLLKRYGHAIPGGEAEVAARMASLLDVSQKSEERSEEPNATL